jgi:hypothetical protein
VISIVPLQLLPQETVQQMYQPDASPLQPIPPDGRLLRERSLAREPPGLLSYSPVGSNSVPIYGNLLEHTRTYAQSDFSISRDDASR